MAMAAGAALLRSVATKMARAPPPPRLPYAAVLEHHGTSSGGRCLSRFSTSTGSTPSSAHLRLRGPQTYYNKKVPSGNEWDWFLAGVIDAAPKAAYGLVFGGSLFIYFYVNPALDRIGTRLDALCDKLNTISQDMEQQRNQRDMHAALDSMASQIEARDAVGEFSKGQRIHASGLGQGKEHL